MSFKLLKAFRDSHDNNYLYGVDDKNNIYPRNGYIPTEERIRELSSNDNKLGQVLIEKVSDNKSEYPKHSGGGWYILSNGEKIQGKDKAIEAENDFKVGDK